MMNTQCCFAVLVSQATVKSCRSFQNTDMVMHPISVVAVELVIKQQISTSSSRKFQLRSSVCCVTFIIYHQLSLLTGVNMKCQKEHRRSL
jgi:hypothetical protein